MEPGWESGRGFRHAYRAGYIRFCLGIECGMDRARGRMGVSTHVGVTIANAPPTLAHPLLTVSYEFATKSPGVGRSEAGVPLAGCGG
jgi:hypothetical protein